MNDNIASIKILRSNENTTIAMTYRYYFKKKPDSLGRIKCVIPAFNIIFSVENEINAEARANGKEFWEYLKFQLFQDFKLLQIREETVKEKLKIARKIVSELENNLEKNNTEKRLELRKMYNERIGIYNHIPI